MAKMAGSLIILMISLVLVQLQAFMLSQALTLSLALDSKILILLASTTLIDLVGQLAELATLALNVHFAGHPLREKPFELVSQRFRWRKMREYRESVVILGVS